jgi:putative molybdopterin biosynthesis protein
MPAGSRAEVTLFTPHVRCLISSSSAAIAQGSISSPHRFRAPVSRCGRSRSAASVDWRRRRRGECDFAPIHLFDESSETYNTPYLVDGLELVQGWRRMQGIVFRQGDMRFEGLSAQDAVRAALADPACIMVNRNQGAGTRILIDGARRCEAGRLLESAALA